MFSDAFFRGVSRFARENGWHLVTDMMHTGAYPRGWKGDGVVALVGYQADLIRHVQSSGVPCIAVPLSDDYVPFPVVRTDNVAIGRMAAEHLLERSYRSFAWAPFIGDRIGRERLHAFESRLADEGCLCHALPPAHRRIGGYWHDDWSEHRRALEAKLRQLPRATAVLASTDCMAAEIMDACGELGISVPDELAVLGVGNDEPLCESARVPISSVDVDMEEVAYRAADTLQRAMLGQTVPEVTELPPKRVVTRRSTDTCAVSNSHVARALSYIAEHFSEPTLSVAEVATAVRMSRRHLERSFRTETGCTMHEHIIKRRMQEASRLLCTHPRAKVADVAALVGVEGAVTFFRTFRRFFGESPREHRQNALLAAAGSGEVGEAKRESA
ncbi:DNA-binding transcriptional regulator [Opitutales bacterium ASA1]|nr:DNA-binding transcriptional regulator [Opitutales bacterium ASA1]